MTDDSAVDTASVDSMLIDSNDSPSTSSSVLPTLDSNAGPFSALKSPSVSGIPHSLIVTKGSPVDHDQTTFTELADKFFTNAAKSNIRVASGDIIQPTVVPLDGQTMEAVSKNTIQELRDAITSLGTDMSKRIEERSAKTEEKIEKIELQLASSEAHNNDNINNLRADIEAVVKKHDAAMQSLANRVNELTQSVKTIETQISELEARNSTTNHVDEEPHRQKSPQAAGQSSGDDLNLVFALRALGIGTGNDETSVYKTTLKVTFSMSIADVMQLVAKEAGVPDGTSMVPSHNGQELVYGWSVADNNLIDDDLISVVIDV